MNDARSLAIYRRLSRLYPKVFRDEFGDDLVVSFSLLLRDGSARSAWRRCVRDLVITLPSQHLEAHRHRWSARPAAITALSITTGIAVLALLSDGGALFIMGLLVALGGLVAIATAWGTDALELSRTPSQATKPGRRLLITGVGLLAIVLSGVKVSAQRDLPLAVLWPTMMFALVGGVALSASGMTLAVSSWVANRRS